MIWGILAIVALLVTAGCAIYFKARRAGKDNANLANANVELIKMEKENAILRTQRDISSRHSNYDDYRKRMSKDTF